MAVSACAIVPDPHPHTHTHPNQELNSDDDSDEDVRGQYTNTVHAQFRKVKPQRLCGGTT